MHGSNEWAIAPSRSATGKALLMSNSHLQWGDIHTYFEVQLTAPGVTSYGAVWVGFPVLRQCFTEYVGWTQTTNNPSRVRPLPTGAQGRRLRARRPGEAVRDAHRDHQGAAGRRHDCATRPLTIRRSVHGPVVAERRGAPIAMRVAALDRPRMFEQFWRMGLAKNFAEWEAAMRMQQLPLFNTAYADRDGHIAYIYNATLPVHATGDYRFWQGVVPGDRSDLIATAIHPYDALPKAHRSARRAGCRTPTTCRGRRSTRWCWTRRSSRPASRRRRASRSARSAASASSAPRRAKMTFEDIKKGKLDTRVETADQFVDEIVATAAGIAAPNARSGRLTCWRRGTGRPRTTATARCSSSSS